jgi:catechol 2,3-dioxygenase-like lactoylglutathione lyase family enzyme
MFRHVGIVVKDLEKQLKFYRDLLSLEVYYSEVEKGYFLENLIGVEGASPLIYKLGKNNKLIVELLFFGNGNEVEKKITTYGLTHFAINVDDIEKLYMQMIDSGIKFISAPLLSNDKKVKVCFCQDYESNYIELVEVL